MKRDKRGFTLIELLVVLAIIGVLFILMLPAIASTRERAHMAHCMNNMKQLAMAAFMYADDHNDVIPDVPDTANYMDDEDVYICPRDTRPGLSKDKPSYTACIKTPDSLLPSDMGGMFSETILYIESDKAGEDGFNRDNINTWPDTEDGGHLAIRHNNSTVVVFADGHIFACTEGSDQFVALYTGIVDPRETP